MGIKLKGLLISVLAITASSVAISEAKAQEVSVDQPTVLENLDNILFNHSGDYYTNRGLFRQLDNIAGFGWIGSANFPELENDRDAEALEEAYAELLFLQTQNTATIRVPDLRSPYNTSVQLLPLSQVGSRVVGSELNFEPLPRR
ncbi:MAG: hypothetical protein AAF152_07405 [Cyanobacteria bacterium P01_A01_bin.114]